MITIYKTENLPKDAQSCEDMKGRAKYFMQIQYMGRHFYLPITKEMKKLLGLSIREGVLLTKNGTAIDAFLRDIISSVYLQVRDTVGEEIHGRLSRQITAGLAEMFDKRLGTTIEGGLNQRLLGHQAVDLHLRSNSKPLLGSRSSSM